MIDSSGTQVKEHPAGARSVMSVLLRELLGGVVYTLKAGPAGGRLRRPAPRPPRPGDHRGTGLTLTTGGARAVPSAVVP